jgi:N-acetylmuramic acid 6-phosphate etherase
LDCRLSHHSLAKILLNSLSTIIMGRLNRYYSNIMTYVKPTNYKLIDRAARYVMILRKGSSYEEVVRAIYELRQKIEYDEPIVLKVIEYLDQNNDINK